ncbi:MAG TPA: SbcC/MukB-like Walker B domain-containing protein [Polyangia bacterium]|nr:SbcC/MukB-like Walker B domain-containing protein [Polyangia bacterium]
MSGSGGDVQPLLDFAASDERAGFRLLRLEVLNWGTFHHQVWPLQLDGDNALLTGDIGSGKSTLVDAVTTLLVPPQRIAYNRAAGAELRERSLRSYVLGYYKAERSETGAGARPVPLRDANTYSVILGHFFNEGYGQHVTLAQVFWIKDAEGQPARLYVLADEALSIKDHFAGFGTDLGQLRKRLRGLPRVEVWDSFPPYGGAFRRRFGIENEQALELFHQTVSMKSVGSLTDFVREHMLEEIPVTERIEALCAHFEDLNRAHEAVLKAKEQIARLTPIAADCERHAEVTRQMDETRACRDALRSWFAARKRELLETRLANLAEEAARTRAQADKLEIRLRELRGARDDVKEAIARSGGDRLERLGAEIARKQVDKEERRERAARYDRCAAAVGLPPAADEATFYGNQRAAGEARATSADRQAAAQNARTDAEVTFRRLRDEHDEISAELTSLRNRRSNIPARMLELRRQLCAALGEVAEDDLPFAGELIQVRIEERAWEGATERLLHNFGLSLLVTDEHYASVADWVDRTHLGGRLVYYRVREARGAERTGRPSVDVTPRSLVHKLAVKPESPLYEWLRQELAQRFDYACCDSLEQFRREQRAITRAGQTKGRGDRHEKDDTHRIDDRSRYVLGWSNEEKIATLEKQQADVQARLQAGGVEVARLHGELEALSQRLADLQQLLSWSVFRELDWKPLVVDIQTLQDERARLEAASDVLRALAERLAGVERDITAAETELKGKTAQKAEISLKESQARALAEDCAATVAAASQEALDVFARIAELRALVPGPQTLTVESCDNREKDMREWLQARLDADKRKCDSLAEKIVTAMAAYRKDHPLETQEVDASVAAGGEYVAMLEKLRSDDLPRFEARFKDLLNVNTIREVANFQSQLHKERQNIRDRIGVINRSLREIDYNPGRYVVLEDAGTTDVEIRDFQQDLRACTEGALTGSEEETYSERKFEQVRQIIQRFRGRPGTEELDRRWTRKVTDVRNWFVFAASERWREDDREHEHYSDSGGKSGGQKEKLAYTVLAASLAYQFGLEWGAKRSRSFRFVVIDEAFGRGSDESARYALALFAKLRLQLLIVTPLQKIHVIEPHVAAVGFVHNEEGRRSLLRNLTIEEYRAERALRSIGNPGRVPGPSRADSAGPSPAPSTRSGASKA